jgi:hypothetical protein
MPDIFVFECAFGKCSLFWSSGHGSIGDERWNFADVHIDKCCAALPLQMLRGSAATNVARLCRYKCCAALPLQMLRGFAATNVARLCRYKYCAALPLQILRGSAATNIARLCRYGGLNIPKICCKVRSTESFVAMMAYQL